MVLRRFGSNCWSGCAAPITIATSAVSQPVYPFSFQMVSASSCITVGELTSLNRYAYANGNPTNLVDPTGMFAEDPNLIGSYYQGQIDYCDLCNVTGDFWACKLCHEFVEKQPISSPPSKSTPPPTNTQRPPQLINTPTCTATPSNTATSTASATQVPGPRALITGANIHTSPCSQKFYPPFGDDSVCPQLGQCKPIHIGNKGYQQSGPHRARDYVPNAAGGQRGGWETQPTLAQYNQVYAVANGNITRIYENGQLIPDAITLQYNIDQNGNGWEFVYVHISLYSRYDPIANHTSAVGVAQGTPIGTLINYLQASNFSGDASDVTHLHFGVRVYPLLSTDRVNMNDDPDNCF